jgi:deoxycytidine triphosphate deaminase
MYLGKDQILKRIREEGLLSGCDEEYIQGAGADLRIERLFEVTSGALVGREKREPPELKEVDGEVFILKPKGYYLCLTKEELNMPLDLVAFLFPRSTIFRCGASLKTAVIDPGYKGALTIGIKNESGFELRLEKGARIAQVVFSLVQGEAERYKGKYQGGRVR